MNHRLALPLVLVSLIAAGCASHLGSVVGPGMNAKREANFVALAVKQTGCPAAQLQVDFVESIERNVHVYRATGCQRSYDAFLQCLPMVGCGWLETPDTRASFDLQCPRERLTRTYLGQGSFGIVGCGKSITYVQLNGQFVANGPVNAAANSPAPVPPVSPGASTL